MQQPDEITLNWLERSKELSSKLLLQLWHLLAKAILSVFMTQTDVNGLLRRGSMFILSELQFQHLLLRGGIKESFKQSLDVSIPNKNNFSPRNSEFMRSSYLSGYVCLANCKY